MSFLNVKQSCRGLCGVSTQSEHNGLPHTEQLLTWVAVPIDLLYAVKINRRYRSFVPTNSHQLYISLVWDQLGRLSLPLPRVRSEVVLPSFQKEHIC